MSPHAFRRVTLVALVALYLIVVSGGAVRLTGSGLGCPDWPTCAEGRLVAPWEYHAMVEWVNRVVTGVVSVVVILAVLGSLVRRPRRPDLVRYSLGLVAGVVAQVVLGGITVLYDLAPPLVMGHFLVSMVLLWCAVVLHLRAGLPDDAPPSAPATDVGVVRMTRLLVAATGLTIVLGTVVTGTGPHGGDETAPRFGFELREVTRLHGIAAVLLVALTVYTVTGLVRSRGAAALVRRAEVLMAVLVAQGAVGYVQYFTGVPALLVGVHIAGAAAVWVSVVWLHGTAVLGDLGESTAWQRRLLSRSNDPMPTTSSAPTAPGW